MVKPEIKPSESLSAPAIMASRPSALAIAATAIAATATLEVGPRHPDPIEVTLRRDEPQSLVTKNPALKKESLQDVPRDPCQALQTLAAAV
jgi:hypothetical protein